MKKLFILFVTAIITSCAVNKVEKENTNPNVQISGVEDEETQAESPENSLKRAEYRASRTILTDLIHTKLEVNFDWQKSRMNGVATITAKPHFYASDSLILDAKGMDILDISLSDKKLNYTYDSLVLKIKLDKIYSKSEQYSVKIKYVAKPDERLTSGSKAITSDKGLYFINPKGEDKTKMPQIWTQGETEASSVWFPTIDAPNTKTTQEIYITVDKKYVTLSNGKLISSKSNPDGTRTDYWKQELPHAPYLFMMGVGEFKVVKDFFTRKDGSKMEVNYYVEPEWEQSAKAIFGETPKMIEYFSKLLDIEYPWDKYHQIVVREYVSGAMENTGAVVFGDYVYKNDRELLDDNDQSTIAHELFHHWFGDLVTCESWSNLTLNESFANYSQYLWDEFRYGLDEAAYQAEIEAEGYYQSAQASGYHDLVWFNYEDKEQMFDGHSYNKGGRILHMLRNYVGDEAFFKAISNYLRNNKFNSAEFHQLRIEFEKVCGEDLNWFFNQWYLASGHPFLGIRQEIDQDKKTVKVIVEQMQNLETSPIYKLPVQVAIYDSEGKHIHKVTIDGVTNEFTFAFKGELKCVITDDQQMLLAKKTEDKPAEQFIYQYYNGGTYAARKQAIQLGKNTSESYQKMILDALNDPFWNIKIMALERFNKLSAENKSLALNKVKELALKDEKSLVRAKAISILAKEISESEMITIYNDRFQQEKSYHVLSGMLRDFGQVNPKLALEKAKTLEKENSSKMISAIGQLYQKHAGPEAYQFFENALNARIVKSYEEIGLINSFLVFMVNQKNPDFFEKAFPLLEKLSKTGDMYTKMFLPQSMNYLSKYFEKEIEDLNTEIQEHEKNNNAAYADQARKKIGKFKSLIEVYNSVKPTQNVEH